MVAKHPKAKIKIINPKIRYTNLAEPIFTINFAQESTIVNQRFKFKWFKTTLDIDSNRSGNKKFRGLAASA
jgi:hypothetical protein